MLPADQLRQDVVQPDLLFASLCDAEAGVIFRNVPA